MAASTLQELTRNDWTLIESKAKRINFSLGQEIIQEGARIDHVYILRRGSASVELKGTHSNAILATLAAAISVAKWLSSATVGRPQPWLPRKKWKLTLSGRTTYVN
jgi:hypothetical protein